MLATWHITFLDIVCLPIFSYAILFSSVLSAYCISYRKPIVLWLEDINLKNRP